MRLALLVEVSRSDDDQPVGIDVLAESLGDLGWREGEDCLFLVGVEGEGAVGVQVADDLAGDCRIAGAAHLLGFHVGLLCVGNLLVGWTVFEEC